MAHRSVQQLSALLEANPVVTFNEIQGALDQASRATAFRYLKQVPYRRSYNHNGQFYTRHDPDRYDQLGFWSHGDLFFSRDGSLKLALRRLIHESVAGYTYRELSALLRVQVQFALTTAMQDHAIDRAAIEGVYVYLHPAADIQASQLEQRREQISQQSKVAMSEALVIEVLLVLIRHPGAAAGDVVRHLRGSSPPVSRPQVDLIIDRYRLAEKKTIPSGS